MVKRVQERPSPWVRRSGLSGLVYLYTLEGHYSVLLVSYVMWSGALDSPHLLLLHDTLTLAYHISIILISTLFYK